MRTRLRHRSKLHSALAAGRRAGRPRPDLVARCRQLANAMRYVYPLGQPTVDAITVLEAMEYVVRAGNRGGGMRSPGAWRRPLPSEIQS